MVNNKSFNKNINNINLVDNVKNIMIKKYNYNNNKNYNSSIYYDERKDMLNYRIKI